MSAFQPKRTSAGRSATCGYARHENGKKSQCENDDSKEQSRCDALQAKRSIGCDNGCRKKRQQIIPMAAIATTKNHPPSLRRNYVGHEALKTFSMGCHVCHRHGYRMFHHLLGHDLSASPHRWLA